MSVHYQEAEKNWIKTILADADKVTVYSEVMRKLHAGYYNQSWVDVFFQKWARYGKVNIAEACAFAQLWSGLCNGAIAHTRLVVGQSPLNDAEIEGNNAILQNALSLINSREDNGEVAPDVCKWRAGFWGGSQDADGYIEWDGIPVLEFHRNAMPAGSCKSEWNRAALEVGYTHCIKTLNQLRMSRILARWPYDSREITLLEVIDPKYMGC